MPFGILIQDICFGATLKFDRESYKIIRIIWDLKLQYSNKEQLL